jgi:hypothetical protein
MRRRRRSRFRSADAFVPTCPEPGSVRWKMERAAASSARIGHSQSSWQPGTQGGVSWAPITFSPDRASSTSPAAIINSAFGLRRQAWTRTDANV